MSDPMAHTAGKAPALAARLVSLGVVRGLTMLSMVIVNNPGDWNHASWPLLHADQPDPLLLLLIEEVSMVLSMGGWGGPCAAMREHSFRLCEGTSIHGPTNQVGRLPSRATRDDHRRVALERRLADVPPNASDNRTSCELPSDVATAMNTGCREVRDGGAR
jgi:hypothetical protein